MKMTKRVLSIVMAIVTLVSVMGIAAEAASISLGKLNLGYMAPTNAKGTKTVETITLYGDYDYINFYINSKKNNSYFFYEIYSDKDYQNAVGGDFVYCDKGTYTFTPQIKLKGNYKSKTYYMVTYAAKIYSDGSAKIDQNSMCEFKVVVKRTADFDDKIVMLKSVKNTYNGPKITWSALSGANKYFIYRRSITGKKWTKVGTVSSSKKTFTDTSLKNKNGNYIYSVKAVNKKGTSSRYLYSGLTCLFAKAPVISSVSVIADNAVQIKWSKTKTGAKYTIMRKEGNGKWKTIKSNYTGTTYKDTTAKNGKTYKYTIKSTITTDYGKTTSGYYTTNGKAVTYLKAPTLNEALAVENGVNVSWKAVSGATGYTIFRKYSDGSTGWENLGMVGADVTNFVDTSASIETGYIYTIRSEAASNNGSYNNTGIEYIYVAPEIPETTDPEVSEPDVSEPDVSEPDVTQPTTEPETTNPAA